MKLSLALAPERPRPKEIHAEPCLRCPSAVGAILGHDPETLDYIAAPRELQLESLFVCAWRPDKLCKGYCDALNVTEADL